MTENEVSLKTLCCYNLREPLRAKQMQHKTEARAAGTLRVGSWERRMPHRKRTLATGTPQGWENWLAGNAGWILLLLNFRHKVVS